MGRRKQSRKLTLQKRRETMRRLRQTQSSSPNATQTSQQDTTDECNDTVNEIVNFDSGVWAYLPKEQAASVNTLKPVVVLEEMETPASQMPKDIETVKDKKKRRYQEDSDYRENKLSKKRQRYHEDVGHREEVIDEIAQRVKRKYSRDPKYREEVIERDKQRYREDPEYREKKMTMSKRKTREDPDHREEMTTRSKTKYREDPVHREEIMTRSITKYREDPAHREEVMTRSKSKYREDPVHREEIMTRSITKYREDPAHREEIMTRSITKYREDPVHREEILTRSITKYREDPAHREEIMTRSITKYREDPGHREEMMTRSKTKYREDPEHRVNVQVRAQRRYEEDEVYRATTNLSRSQRRSSQFDNLCDLFQNETSSGPEFVCCSCFKLLFRHQVILCDRTKYAGTPAAEAMAERCIMTTYLHECNETCCDECEVAKSSRSSLWICHTCHRKIKNGVLPSEATVNNLQLSAIPEPLQVTNVLERQLLSLRLPFLKMVALPKGGQYGVYGPVVSVPSNVQDTVSSLPRTDNADSLIRVKLKRNLQYTGYVNYLFVNTSRLSDALEYLKSHNEYYRDVSVSLDDFVNPLPQETVLSDSEDSSPEGIHSSESDTRNDSGELQGIPLDTCLQPVDIGQEFLDQHFEQVFCVAPGQRNSPVSILRDRGNEVMSFPVQFPDGVGHYNQHREQRLTLHRYFVNRLLNVDSRFSNDLTYIFYAQYLNDLQSIISYVSVAVRKGHARNQVGEAMTVGALVNKEHLQNLLRKDKGHKFLRPVRGTPPYWQAVLRDLFATISQIGKPTWFASFSCAEMRWKEFGEAILRMTGRSEKFLDLNWAEKCDVLRCNPIPVSRMFDHRWNVFLKSVILSDKCPIGKISDFFYRIEFQQRGSPHAHCLFWVEDAPEIDRESDEEVVDFIDKYVCCVAPSEDDAALFEQVKNLQMHSKTHSKSCKKRGTTCRFNFPRPPSSKTFVSRPQNNLDSFPNLNRQEAVITAKNILKQVQETLTSSDEINGDIESILQAAGVSQDDFEEATNVLASQTSVVYERDARSMWVNNYNPDLLRCWDANLDIQYITDVHACVMYIISYITKAEREMGLILENADREAKEGNLSAQQSMKKIGGTYLHHREVSAQEAVYRVCELKLKESSRKVVFIPVGSNPVHMSLPLSSLRGKEDDSSEIWLPNSIDKYKLRPMNTLFNEMCLASFCSEYRVLPSTVEPNLNSEYVHRLINDGGYIRKRTLTKPAVVKYPKFSKESNTEEYYLSMLQLFVPHRSDEDLKPDGYDSYEHFFLSGQFPSHNTDTILSVEFLVESNRSMFENSGYSAADIEEVHDTADVPENAWAVMFPQQEAERLQCERERTRPEAESVPDEDIPDLYGVRNRQREQRIVAIQPEILSRHDCIPLMRTMNRCQQKVFYTLRNHCLDIANGHKIPPFHLFLTGSAGTGKSHLIHCISSECHRIFAPTMQNPDEISILLTSATGSAAFNIGGTTLHHAFSLPLDMSLPYINLKEEKVSTLRSKFANLKILIIDEVSLVDDVMLQYIHGRLRQIKQTNDDSPFGNVSILAVGDFYQLSPVGGTALYKQKFRAFDLWNDNFELFELTEIMRQRDSCDFAAMLNRLRTRLQGQPFSSSDIAIMQHCRTTSLPEDVLHIFPTNDEVNHHNATLLKKMCQTVENIPAGDFQKDPCTGRMISCNQPVNTTSKKGLPSHLGIGINAKVMLTRNLDIADGLVNGAIGKVNQIVKNNNRVLSIIVSFENAKVGKQALQRQADKTGVIIERYEERTSIKGCVRNQFPLAVSWAITSHKVQGITTDKAVVSLKKIWHAGMAYVGLSRVRTAEGLKIIDYEPNKIYSSSAVSSYLQKIQTFETIALEEPSSGDEKMFFCLHNTEGLVPHIEDILCNPVLLSKDVLCFTETWLSDNNGPRIEHFYGHFQCRAASFDTSSELFRTYKNKSRGGVAIYTRNEKFKRAHRIETDIKNIEHVVVVDDDATFLIAVIYRPPSYPVSVFLDQLRELIEVILGLPSCWKIILGDFNEGPHSTDTPIKDVFDRYDFRQIVKGPTTESGRILDHVYIWASDSQQFDVRVSPIYYSFHDFVYFDMPL